MRLIVGPPDPDAPPTPAWRRLAWFIGIALASSAAYILLAYALRAPLTLG